MKPIDYGRSFIIGNSPDNEVRFWVESRTRIIDAENGTEEEYIQAASCKSEHTFAAENLFQQDNYDFLPVFGPDYAVIFRRCAYLNDNYIEIRVAGDLWAGQTQHLVNADSVELSGSDHYLAATYDNRPLVAQTKIWNDKTGLRAVIEYPVKTMNTIRRTKTYQVDTGPVAFPDLSRRYERFVESLKLAFVAFNAPHFADVVIEVPTPVREHGATGTELTRVFHYSKIQTLVAEDRLYAID